MMILWLDITIGDTIVPESRLRSDTQLSVPGRSSHDRIVEKLGESGMGVVYQAADTKLDHIVA